MFFMWPLKIVEKANLTIFNDLPLRHTTKINICVKNLMIFMLAIQLELELKT